MTEKEQPARAKDDLEPPYKCGVDNPDEELTDGDHGEMVAVIAAMRQPALLDRRLLVASSSCTHRERSTSQLRYLERPQPPHGAQDSGARQQQPRGQQQT